MNERWECFVEYVGVREMIRLRNNDILGKVRVVPIEDKMKESWLRWFEHMNKIPTTAPVRTVVTR